MREEYFIGRESHDEEVKFGISKELYAKFLSIVALSEEQREAFFARGRSYCPTVIN